MVVSRVYSCTEHHPPKISASVLEGKYYTKEAENPTSAVRSGSPESQHPLFGSWSLFGLCCGYMDACGNFPWQKP